MSTDKNKPWYLSKGVWGSLLTIVAGGAASAGLISPDAKALITSEGPEVLVGIITVLTGAVSLWGRVSAKTAIGPKKKSY